jgi:hypothetical protein
MILLAYQDKNGIIHLDACCAFYESGKQVVYSPDAFGIDKEGNRHALPNRECKYCCKAKERAA